MIRLTFRLLLISLFVAACASSRMSVSQSDKPAHSIRALAIGPGSGVLGDAIGLELFNIGIRVFDANEAVTIIGRAGLEEFEVTTTAGFAALQEKGVDAILTAKAIMADDGTPEYASVRLTDTKTGQVIAGITWQNGWAGTRGSIADRMRRKSMSEAAQQIAREVARRIRFKANP